MKQKGFTLIELLAVIVILAIIALIVAPIVLNIIDDADKNSEAKSAQLYIHAVELAIAKQNMQERFTDATCTVNQGGNLTCGEKSINVDVNNKSEIKGGTITIENRKITGVTNLRVGNGTYNMDSNGKLVRSDSNTNTNTNTQIIYRFTGDKMQVGDSIVAGTKQAWCITNDEIVEWKAKECEKGLGCWFVGTGYSTEEECNANSNSSCGQDTKLAYNSCEDDDPVYYNTQDECNDFKRDYQTCEQGTVPTTGLSSYTEDYTTLAQKVFLKHEVENNIIKSTEACFIKDNNLYCLKPNDYSNSVTALDGAFGTSNCENLERPFCKEENCDYRRCSINGLTVEAYQAGGLNVFETNTSSEMSCNANLDSSCQIKDKIVEEAEAGGMNEALPGCPDC